MRKSSGFLPLASSAESHLGGMPRPAQVLDGSLGWRYFGGTLRPFCVDLRAGAFAAGFFAAVALALPPPARSSMVEPAALAREASFLRMVATGLRLANSFRRRLASAISDCSSLADRPSRLIPMVSSAFRFGIERVFRA